MKKSLIRQLSLILLLLIIACETNIPHNVIAEVGGLTVSSYEFEDTYSHHLLRLEAIDSPKERQIILNRLIKRKLFANAFLSNPIPFDSSAHNLIAEKRKKALLDALYKQIIPPENVSVSDSLLRIHFLWKNTDVFVRHIFNVNKSVIDSVYTLLIANPSRFGMYAQSSFINKQLANSRGSLGWVSYGQMDPAFENAMYNLSVDVISKPVRSAYGWHILQVLDHRVQGIITKSDYEKSKSSLKAGIKQKQNEIVANDYVNNLMLSSAVNINDTMVVSVLRIITKLLENQNSELTFKQEESIQEFRNPLLATLKLLVHKNMAAFDLGSFTVGDFISRLHLLPTNILRQDLLKGFYRLLRDKVLEEQARKLGLENDPMVIIKTQDAKDDVRASLFLSTISQNSHIKQTDLKQITDSLRSIYKITVFNENLDLLF